MGTKRDNFLFLLITVSCSVGISNGQKNRNQEQIAKLSADLTELKNAMETLQTENNELKTTSEEMQKQLSRLEIYSRYTALPAKNWALHHALENEEDQAVRLFVELGANINGKNIKSETPLMTAALCNDTEFGIRMIKNLIELGAKPALKDENGYTFLHKLVEYGTTITPAQLHDISNYLVKKNLTSLFDIPSDLEYTPFMKAVQNVEVEAETLTLLKRNGVNFNAVDYQGKCSLFFATSGKRSKRLLTDLVDHGANSGHVDNIGHNLIHEAATWGNLEGMEFALGLGLDVNTLDDKGETPLYEAVFWNREGLPERVKFLLENGADVNIKAIDGKSPLDVAEEENVESEVVDLLRNN